MKQIASDRALPIEGSVNLRDFGGYATQHGRQVRRGLLLRCGTLAHLTNTGKTQFAGLGVNLICDLRREDERRDEPTPFPQGTPERLEIPIDPGSAVVMRQRLGQADLDLAERRRFMAALTGELTRDHAADYARMFEGLLNLPRGAFLVHCSAGKDRTGVASALILHALGVSRASVMGDYMLTNQVIDYDGYVLPRLVARYEPDVLPDKELVMALAGVHETYLQSAYAAIDAQFEDVEGYLQEALGLHADARAELRARYLE